MFFCFGIEIAVFKLAYSQAILIEIPKYADVTTWRLDRKLAESTPLSNGEAQDGDMADIRVVDQNGDPVENYATGEMDVFNRMVVSQMKG
jgi:hypothetical protein